MAFQFEWGYCELCKSSFVYCPKCGNNCCNAGYGKFNGQECDVCPLAYQYQELAWKTKTAPTQEEIKKMPIPEIIKNKKPMSAKEKELLKAIFADSDAWKKTEEYRSFVNGKNWFNLESERLKQYDKMSKKDKINDIKNNTKSHKHCKNALIQCCFVKDKIDIDLLKAHLEIDPETTKELMKELKKDKKGKTL